MFLILSPGRKGNAKPSLIREDSHFGGPTQKQWKIAQTWFQRTEKDLRTDNQPNWIKAPKLCRKFERKWKRDSQGFIDFSLIGFQLPLDYEQKLSFFFSSIKKIKGDALHRNRN